MPSAGTIASDQGGTVKPTFVKEIKALAKPALFPDGGGYLSLPVASVRQLAQSHGLEGHEIEIAALENNIVPERYARNLSFFSPAEQTTLLRATVALVGLGGLGGAVTEVLARTGIGNLVLIDGDRFEDSNLNRQLLGHEAAIGRFKATAAAERVGAINSSIGASVHTAFLGHATAQHLLSGADVVVDCLDNIATRFVLEAAARKQGLPLVSAALAGAFGQITTIYPDDPGLVSIYGEPADIPSRGAETTLGTLCFTAMHMATLEGAEVVKILLGRGSLLRRKLLLVDLMDHTYEIVALD